VFGLRRRIAVIVVAVSMAATGAVGGVIGAVLATSGAVPSTIALAASTTPTPAAGGQPADGPRAHSGPFVSNENAAHEQGESAAREAQENAGQRPTVP
jgi:hypothetical protein